MTDGFQRVVLPYARAEAEGASLEVRLEYRFQHELGRRLYHAVIVNYSAQKKLFVSLLFNVLIMRVLNNSFKVLNNADEAGGKFVRVFLLRREASPP